MKISRKNVKFQHFGLVAVVIELIVRSHKKMVGVDLCPVSIEYIAQSVVACPSFFIAS